MCPSQIACQSANADPTVPRKDRPTGQISNCDYRALGKGRYRVIHIGTSETPATWPLTGGTGAWERRLSGGVPRQMSAPEHLSKLSYATGVGSGGVQWPSMISWRGLYMRIA